jgi:inorganic pyrophosphatase
MEITVFVEVPMGSRNKYEMDLELGRLRLDRTLFTAMRYPADYGFVPDTLAQDGDPLDAMVLTQEATFPGCEVTARPVAVFWMRDEGGPDAKLLCVPATDVRWGRIRDLEDIPQYQRAEIQHFFDVYKELEPGKSTEVRGWQPRAEAEQVLADAVQRAQDAKTQE